jgi:transglutaminase-like putative cysteine protease
MRMQIPLTPSSLRVTLQALPDGVAGIKYTLAQMVKYAQAGRKSPPVRFLAEQIVRDVKPKSYTEEARAIQEYVRDHIRYTRDIRGTETLATPDQTIRRGVGDCDDMSLLASALLESIGHPTRFVAVGASPGDYSHVLVETRVGRNWIPVETTENVPLGWYPPGMNARLVYHVPS